MKISSISSLFLQISLFGRIHGSKDVLNIDVLLDNCVDFTDFDSCSSADCVWCVGGEESEKSAGTCVRSGNEDHAKNLLGNDAICKEANFDPSAKDEVDVAENVSDGSLIIPQTLGGKNNYEKSGEMIGMSTDGYYKTAWSAIVDCYIAGAHNAETRNKIIVKFYDVHHNYIGQAWNYGSKKCWRRNTAWTIKTNRYPKYIYIITTGYDAYLIDNLTVRRNKQYKGSNRGNWCLSKDYYDYIKNDWKKYHIYRCYSSIKFTLYY